MRVLRCATTLLAAAALAAPTPAQKREPIRGAVVTATGEPWQGAEVELISRLIDDDDRFGEADVVHAVTDAKGRFDAALLPCRRYLAWAHAEQPDGTYIASFAIDDVHAVLPLVLTADAPRPHTTVRIDGLAPWRAHGAITCTLLARHGVLLTAPCTERDGTLVLPAFPYRRAGLELRCGDRPLLPWPESLNLTAAAENVTVKAPRQLRFRCLDDAGKPVADCAFLAADFNGRRATAVIGRSDALGMLSVLLPIGEKIDWVNYPMQLRSAGKAPRSTIARLQVSAGYDAAVSPPLHSFDLANSRAQECRLLLGEQPLGRTALRLDCTIRSADRTPASHSEPLLVTTDDDGRLAFDLDARFPAMLSAVLSPAAVARLPADRSFPLHPEVLLATLYPNAKTANLPLAIDLLQLARLDVQVLGADGVPSGAVQLGIAFKAPGAQGSLAARTNRMGRLRLLLPPQLQFVLCAWSPAGAAWMELDASKLTAPVVLRLAPCRSTQGTLVDGKGKPVPFAGITWFVGPSSSGLESALCTCLHNQLHVRTDAAGNFTLPLYANVHYSVSQVATADDEFYPRGIEFTVGTDEPKALVVDLSREQ